MCGTFCNEDKYPDVFRIDTYPPPVLFITHTHIYTHAHVIHNTATSFYDIAILLFGKKNVVNFSFSFSFEFPFRVQTTSNLKKKMMKHKPRISKGVSVCGEKEQYHKHVVSFRSPALPFNLSLPHLCCQGCVIFQFGCFLFFS